MVKKINSLMDHTDQSKTAGPDITYSRILKDGSSIAKELDLIFKRYITFGDVLKDWKTI